MAMRVVSKDKATPNRPNPTGQRGALITQATYRCSHPPAPSPPTPPSACPAHFFRHIYLAFIIYYA